MYKPRGKNFFKNSSVALSIIYVALFIGVVYCLGILVLPPFATWCYGAINKAMEFLSFGNAELLEFNKGFFYSCTGTLVVIGITLKVVDRVNLKKEKRHENEELDT